MSGTLYWRLVIRNADDDADLLVLSSYPGDDNPCLASPPSGDGQRLDPITGKSSIGAYTIRTVDVVTSGTDRVVTSKLVDAKKRQQLISRRAYVKYSTDGATWSVLVAGFVNRVRLVGALTYEFTVGETQRVEQNLEIFKRVTDTYDQVSCLCGGPVRGGFGPLHDYGPWKMRVAQVYADKFVRLKYLSGYQRRSRETITDFHPLGGYEYIAGGITRYEDQRVNQISRAYYEPLPGYSANGIAGWYPKLIVRVEDASGNLIGQFRPLNRIDSTITVGSITIVGPHIALVDNSDLNVLWDGTNGDDGTGTAPDQPDDESIVYVYVYPEEIDENNPIHISGHPVDIITGLWDDAGLAYSSTDAATAKTALGSALRYDLRITQSAKMGEFVAKLCAVAGLGVRFNSSGERSLVSLRIPPSTSPTTTLTLDDLRSVEPPIFDVDEKSMIDKVTFKTESYSPWNPAKYGEDSAHPIDELVVTPRVVSTTAEDADGEHEQTFEIQGQIRVTGIPGIFQDLAWLGSGLDQAGAYAVSRAREIFDRRQSGAIVSEIACVRGVTAVPGDEITLDLDHLPNDNDRGGERIVQVLGRTETPQGPTLYVEDAGVSVQPSTVPTYTIEKDTTADPKRYATISITNASSLITDGSNCRIEIATGASPTSWVHFATITPTEMGTVTSWRSPRVDAGAVVNVRMRAEEQGKRPSAYGTTKSVTLTALAAPSSLSAAAVTDDDTAADLTWTAGETLVPVVVQWKETADTVYDHSVTLPAGSTQYRVRGLAASTAYTFKVFYRETAPWAGVSTSVTDTLTAGDTTPTCDTPDNPRIFAGSVDPATGGLVVDGSYGLEVTATELPSFTVFEVAVEGEGDALLLDWEPGDSTSGFTRTGTAEYVDSNLNVASAATGVARDSDYSTGERALVLEPARTNGWTYSGDMSQSVWSKSFTTAATDGTVGPDGSTLAYLVKPDANAVAAHEIRRSVAGATDDTASTFTYELKAGGYNYAAFTLLDKSGAAFMSVVNVSNGAIVSRASQHTIVVTPLANGWYRFAFSASVGHGGTTPSARLRVSDTSAAGSYTGNGTSGIYWAYGGVEVDAAYGTSPIRTTSATASRGAEALTRSSVMTSGLSATQYHRYYDEATDAEVEEATAITTGTDFAFTTGRKYYRVKIAEGTFTAAQMRDMVSSGTYGDYAAVPKGTVQSVQGARTVWRGIAPNDGKRRSIRAKHTAPGKDDSSYTPVLDVNPWTATRPHDYPVPIPTDFSVGSVVLGTQVGGVSYAIATYTPPAVTTGFSHMEYSVRSRVTTDGDTAPWGAPTSVPGGAYGSDHIPVTPGTDCEVTPITVSQDGTGKRGSGSEVKTITVPKYVVGAPSIADPVAGSSAITYEVLDFAGAAYIRWWHKTYTSGTVPASAVSVEATGTEGPRFEPGGMTVQQGGAIDATNLWELATFVPYDANNQRGTAANTRTQRATPTAPSAPTAAASSHTGSTVTNSVTMPASITNADKIRVYRDGVKYGSDVPRTAGASSAQSVTSSSLAPGTAYQWQYSLVSDAGAESAKSTAFTVTTDDNTIPTPSCSLTYSTAAQAFTIHVLPGVDAPSGVTYHLKIDTTNPPTTERTGSASTSTTLSYAISQTSDAVTFYAKVWGVKAGWTDSSESSVASGTRPALDTGGGTGGPPIDPT